MILMNLLAGKKWRLDENLSCVGQSGKESGTNGKVALTYICLSCIKQIVCEKLLYNIGSSAWPSMMT